MQNSDDYLGLDYEQDTMDPEELLRREKLRKAMEEDAQSSGDDIDMQALMDLVDSGKDTEPDYKFHNRGNEGESAAELEGKAGYIPNQIAPELGERDNGLFTSEPKEAESDDSLDMLNEFTGGGKDEEFLGAAKDDITKKESDLPKEVSVEKVSVKKPPAHQAVGEKRYEKPLDLGEDIFKKESDWKDGKFSPKNKIDRIPTDAEEAVGEETLGGFLPRGEGAGASEAITPLLGAGASSLLRKILGKAAGPAAEAVTKKGPPNFAESMAKKAAESASKAGPKEGKFFDKYFGEPVNVGGKMGRTAHLTSEAGTTELPRSQMTAAIKTILDKVKNGKFSERDIGNALRKLGLTEDQVMSIVGGAK